MYDSANQLVRENNQAGNFTHTWTYDSAGNITARTEYAYTTGELGTPTDTVTYSYGNTNWGDLLTAYDGTAFTYETTSDGNTIGNLLSDGTWTYTWQHGRQLSSMYSDNGTGDDISDDVTWTYTYNADGLRTKRTDGTTTYNYIYNGSQLSQMTVGTNTLYFAYDASGVPMSVTYDGNNTDTTDGITYYYITNIQGDVIAITDSTGTSVVTYSYDAWGNILSTDGTMKDTLGTHNPLRYRGYVYDTETGLYYLQSRYYNPEIGRFINADAFAATGQGILGNNMFVYCNNNPVMFIDPIGLCVCIGTRLSLIDCGKFTCPESSAYVEPTGTYDNGDGYVYIISPDEKDYFTKDSYENVTIILDYRTNNDPNMQILNSYKITSNQQQEEIVQIMIDYNVANLVTPPWSRTFDSLIKEWKIHNNAYFLGVARGSTAHCDFNNADEGKGYWDFFYERILK